MYKIAVLGSTRGTYLPILMTHSLPGKISLVISNRKDALILKRAAELKLPNFLVSSDEMLHQVLIDHNIDLILLIGFMRILPASFTEKWQGKILNVHPSLLPKYAGLMDLKVHEVVLAHKDPESGCTVHEVTAVVDGGPIIVQKRCPVLPDDTPASLKAKVQNLEIAALVEAIKLKLPVPIRTALLSVSDKTNLIMLAQGLHQLGIKLISTGGTAKALEAAGLPFTAVADLTGYPEMMDGRVKTLHPRIHGGILGLRDHHDQEAKTHAIHWIDLVVVNLYPFQVEPTIENIDIGGPTLLRAAAKNHAWVSVVHDPQDYAQLLTELQQHQSISYKTRHHLAAKAFSHTAQYDAHIAHYLSPDLLTKSESALPYHRLEELRYGENPHQQAILVDTPFGYGLAQATLLQGKALSYNNLVDAEAALHCVRSFNSPACVVVKHANPCGVAVAPDIETAYDKAFHADAKSAFGGVIALNHPCNSTIAHQLNTVFVEVIIAPSFTAEALALLAKKPNLRVLTIAQWYRISCPYSFKAISGGMLIQSSDQQDLDPNHFTFVTNKTPDQAMLQELLFAWQVVKHLKSNAIAITKKQVTVGLSGGQVSRIDALNFALQKSKVSLDGAVLASDGFFPFRDSIDALADSGIKTIIQPGGSIRDQEVIAACNEYDIAMIFTHIRCFNH